MRPIDQPKSILINKRMNGKQIEDFFTDPILHLSTELMNRDELKRWPIIILASPHRVDRLSSRSYCKIFPNIFLRGFYSFLELFMTNLLGSFAWETDAKGGDLVADRVLTSLLALEMLN
ncbi:hypothetical protein VNO77_46221 [Canavalia gladiata]|uniref:Uncharacterized protein n=1 Tax=Canavalia gladiata TaxID=3824 RepID=A0AAN9JIP9_CANGL